MSVSFFNAFIKACFLELEHIFEEKNQEVEIPINKFLHFKIIFVF